MSNSFIVSSNDMFILMNELLKKGQDKKLYSPSTGILDKFQRLEEDMNSSENLLTINDFNNRPFNGLSLYKTYYNPIDSESKRLNNPKRIHKKSMLDAIAFYLSYRDIDHFLSSKVSSEDKFNFDQETLNTLQLLGLDWAKMSLKNSDLNPLKVMRETKKELSFMGISGSKWINNMVKFEEFLSKIQSVNGNVKFLVMNPYCKNFEYIHTIRGEFTPEETNTELEGLVKKYFCFQVKYYEFTPIFRLIFKDQSILGFSRYKWDSIGFNNSGMGWESPHLSFNSESSWSLYYPFEKYFEDIWNNQSSSFINLQNE